MREPGEASKVAAGMEANGPDYARLDQEASTLVFALAKGSAADLVYLGARLPEDEDLAALALATARSLHESQSDRPPTPGLLSQRREGWSGTPAVSLGPSDENCDEAPHLHEVDLRLSEWEARAQQLSLTYQDDRFGLEIEQRWRITASGMITAKASITNTGAHAFTLDGLSALAMPIPARFDQLISFSGRWASEMHETRQPLAPTGFARHSAIGKPGFGGGNWLVLEDEASDEVLGAHLAWSGDYDTRVECDNAGASDGRPILQMGARLDSGEVTLEPGARHETPEVLITAAPDRSALAQRFHRHAREQILPKGTQTAPRKVHLNSWEALGFNLSEPDLFALVDAASELGIERFVLDDGWFGGTEERRQNDRTSLGDWFVSRDVFPAGLTPLIEHVKAKGMDFGLWVEPEMLSPQSDLYRAHPDWCLHTTGAPRPTMRNQLVLDLTKPEVTAYLAERLNALLTEHDIAYLKWDHNRDLFPLTGKGTAHTRALYRLIDDLRAAHPAVEIESCSSGGGRIDYGILARTDRIWPSDNNDAIERLRIIPAWSQFVPLEVLGNHVGPSPNPITGRRLAMDFRAKVALFGHMGVEADPRAMREADRTNLAAHIALYKQWRGTLHAGDLWRLDHPDPGVGGLMVTHQDTALALVGQTQFSPAFDAAPIRLKGLEPETLYRVTLPQPWPPKAALYLPNAQSWQSGVALSGQSLMTQGLALPLTHPETAWLIALEKITT
ncbi:MAG: alpha-galactosidase [Pseudomonadota bacterium]